MIIKKRSLSLLMALILLAALFASCAPRRGPDADDPTEPPEIERIPGPYDVLTIGDITPRFSYEIADAFERNDHTVGWIDVPGTNIHDVVLRNPDCVDNLYYLRRNFYREFYFNGVYYVDVRADLGPTREYLGVNTTIYGHAMTDDPSAEAFDIKFGNLHRFRDPEFARYHPYIFFSLPEEDLAFEIIAIFYGNSSYPPFSYNDNPANPADFITVIEETVFPRSLFLFDDIEIGPEDRFLTLSTCIYNVEGVNLLHHSETEYRFAIMARLVDPDKPLLEYVDFTINEDRVVDPDGRWPL